MLELHPSEALSLYRRMRLIRVFEERIVALVHENQIAGVTHEYIGEEAVAVGICAALDPSDVITSTHRGHGHLLAKGADPQYMIAELFGRDTGYNRGQGGSMHIADLTLGVLGANGLVAGGVPFAVGAGWAFRQRQANRVAVAFFGDGAVNQGVWHEALNMAAIWKLPVIFVCENNGYAVSMPIAQAMAVNRVAERAAAYGMPGMTVDGMDVRAVLESAREAVAYARAGRGPTLLECVTYRFSGHHTGEAAQGLHYRTPEEIQKWRLRDPLDSYARFLMQDGKVTPEILSTIDGEITEQLNEAIVYASQSAWPADNQTLQYMYATPVPGYPRKGWI